MFVEVLALDAQFALADGMALDRQRAYNFAVQSLEIDPAATATVHTSCQNVLILH